MPDYEKGSAAWDIGMVLTRHADGLHRSQHGDFAPCARVLELKRTARSGKGAGERLEAALSVTCTCGAGDSKAERSSHYDLKMNATTGQGTLAGDQHDARSALLRATANGAVS